MKLSRFLQYIYRNPITVAIGVVAMLFLLIRSNLFHAASKPIPSPLPKVSVLNLTAQPIVTSIQLNGHTAEARCITLKAKTPGRILSLSATKGQKLDSGQDVILIDPETRPTRLEEARSKLNQRFLEYKASTKLEAKAFKAQNALAASKADYDNARSLLATIEQEIADTHIQAPFKSILEETFVEVGDVVNVGDKVATIIELDPLKIICNISEKDISRVKEGRKAQVLLTSVEDKQLTAEVIFISKAADPKTRTYRVELSMKNPGMTIPAGLTARIIFPTDSTHGYLISPAAVSLRDDGTIGIKVVENGKVVFFPIEIIETKLEGLLVSGAPEKISLITTGGDFVIEGQEVTSSETHGTPDKTP